MSDHWTELARPDQADPAAHQALTHGVSGESLVLLCYDEWADVADPVWELFRWAWVWQLRYGALRVQTPATQRRPPPPLDWAGRELAGMVRAMEG